MKRSPEDFVEALFRFVVVASGILTTILLISALLRLLDGGLGSLAQP